MFTPFYTINFGDGIKVVVHVLQCHHLVWRHCQYRLIGVIGKSVVPHQIFEWSVCFKRSPKNQNTFHLLKIFLPLNCTFSWIFGALCLVLSNQNKSEPILEVPPHCNTNDLSRKQDQDLL